MARIICNLHHAQNDFLYYYAHYRQPSNVSMRYIHIHIIQGDSLRTSRKTPFLNSIFISNSQACLYYLLGPSMICIR